MEISISIMREVIFRTDSQSGGCAADTHQLQRILPMLLSLLDERDSTAKAVILLMAELCYVYPSEKSYAILFYDLLQLSILFCISLLIFFLLCLFMVKQKQRWTRHNGNSQASRIWIT